MCMLSYNPSDDELFATPDFPDDGGPFADHPSPNDDAIFAHWSDEQDAALIRIANAACPKCDGPMHFSEAKWVHCPACSSAKPACAAILRGDDTMFSATGPF